MRKKWRDIRRLSLVAWLVLFLLGFCVTAVAEDLQAWLQTTQIGEGQSVDLYLVAPATAGGDPELSALREDFDVSKIVEGSQVQMLNGYPTNMRSWQLTLTPKRPGRLTVPALRLGQAVSAPLVLEVFPAGQVPANRVLRDVMLQTLVSQQRPFVQGKVIYTIRLYTRLDLRQVHFSEPEVMDTLVERLGEDTKYNTHLGRYRYHVLQRRFVLFPQRSGRLSIISPQLNAQVREKQRQWPLQLRGPEIMLDVQTQPDVTVDPWLPAESLSLSEIWSPDPPLFRVGEPVNRSVVITAQGLTAAQLPDLPQSAPPGISLYPERPISSTQASVNTLVTKKVINYAFVPKREGTYHLPVISLAWWDTTTGQRRTAVLPGRDILVQPGTGQGKAETQPATDAGYLSELNLSLPDLVERWRPWVRKAWDGVTTSWPWLLLILVLAWLARSVLRWRGSRMEQTPETSAAPVPSAQPPGNAWRRFERACNQGDPHMAREALIEWAAGTWPDDPPQRLDQLAQRLPPGAAVYLSEIDRALYAATPEAWDGKGTLAALQGEIGETGNDKAVPRDSQALPPLY